MTPAEHYAEAEAALDKGWFQSAQTHGLLALAPPAYAATTNRDAALDAAHRFVDRRGADLALGDDEAQDSAIADLVDVILAAAGHP